MPPVKVKFVKNGRPFNVSKDDVSMAALYEAQDAVDAALAEVNEKTSNKTHDAVARALLANANQKAALAQAEVFIHDILSSHEKSLRDKSPRDVLGMLSQGEATALLTALGLRPDKPTNVKRPAAEEVAEEEAEADPSS